MHPEIVSKPAFSVVGMLLHTTPKSPEIPELWGQFGPRIDEVPHLAEPGASYGLMSYNEQTNQLDYMAGCTVEKVADLPKGMTQWEVTANTYAVFEATLPTIGEVFDYIFGTWLPTSDYQEVAAPHFERYGETFNPHDPASKCSIYIPVAKKEG